MGPSLWCEVALMRRASVGTDWAISYLPWRREFLYCKDLMLDRSTREKKVEELVPSTPSSCTCTLSSQILFPSIEYDSEHVRLKYVANATWLQLSTNRVLRYKNHISWPSSKHIPRPTSLFTWIFHDVKMARFYAEINVFKGACLTYRMTILVVTTWR